MDVSIRPEQLDPLSQPNGARADDGTLAEDLSLCSEITKGILYDLAQNTPSLDPDNLTDDEVLVLVRDVPEIQNARLHNKPELAEEMLRKTMRAFTRLKKAELVKRNSEAAGGSKFRAPKITFPKLKFPDEYTERGMEDTIAAHVWVRQIRDLMLRNRIDDAMALELAKPAVPESILLDVSSALTMENVFQVVKDACPIARLAYDYIKTQLSVKFEGGRITVASTAQEVVKKCRVVLKRLDEIVALDTRLDLPRHEVGLILNSFGVNYGGTAEEISNTLEAWWKLFEQNKGMLIHQLKRKVKAIRKYAFNYQLSDATNPTGISNNSHPDAEVSAVVKGCEKRIQSLETELSRVRMGTGQGVGVQMGGMKCWSCGVAGHATAACKLIMEVRDQLKPLPGNLCQYCLKRKDDKSVTHVVSKTNGCHIGPASMRMKNSHGDRHLLRDSLCYEHQVNVAICGECYRSSEGKQANRNREPRYIKSS